MKAVFECKSKNQTQVDFQPIRIAHLGLVFRAFVSWSHNIEIGKSSRIHSCSVSFIVAGWTEIAIRLEKKKCI